MKRVLTTDWWNRLVMSLLSDVMSFPIAYIAVKVTANLI